MTALGIGLIAFLITLLVVWNTLPGTLLSHSFPLGSTRFQLVQMAKELKREKEQMGVLPKTLTLAKSLSSDNALKDSWGHPLTYVISEGVPVVGTLGRDGKPGGVGFDADFTSESKTIPRPTLVQLLQPTGNATTDDYLGKCLLCCLFNGGLWSLAAVLSKDGGVRNKMWNYAGLLVIFWMTIFGALVMAALDVPTGH